MVSGQIQIWELFGMAESEEMGETSKRTTREEKSRGLKTRMQRIENCIYHCSREHRSPDYLFHVSNMESNASLHLSFKLNK